MWLLKIENEYIYRGDGLWYLDHCKKNGPFVPAYIVDSFLKIKSRNIWTKKDKKNVQYNE